MIVEWQNNLEDTVLACFRELYRNSSGHKRNAVGTYDLR
jgi:hypothetical protein